MISFISSPITPRKILLANRVRNAHSRKNILNNIQDVLVELSKIKIKNPSNPKHIKADRSVTLTQFFVSRLFTSKFNILLLCALSGKYDLLYPIPREWISFLEKSGYHVNRNGCLFLFNLYFFLVSVKRFFLLIKLAFSKNSTSNCDRSIYLYDPPHSAFKELNTNINNFFTWVVKKGLPGNGSLLILHNNPNIVNSKFENIELRYSPYEIFINFKGLKARIVFLYSLILMLVKCFSLEKLFFLYDDVIVSNLRSNFSSLNVYYVTNSNFHYRAYWTYFANLKLKSKFKMFFYSLNYKDIPKESSIFLNRHSFDTVQWDQFLCWNEYHAADVVANSTEYRNVCITGPVGFEGGAIKNTDFLELPSSKSIAVFDVVPGRRSVELGYCFRSNYYSFKNIEKFYLDIFNTCECLNLNFLIKPKRTRGNNTHKSYLKLMESISRKENVFCFDGNVAPSLVLDRAACVICIPYTSVAYMAAARGIPTIFYDPTGSVSDSRSLTGTVFVCKNPDELKNIIVSLLD